MEGYGKWRRELISWQELLNTKKSLFYFLWNCQKLHKLIQMLYKITFFLWKKNGEELHIKVWPRWGLDGVRQWGEAWWDSKMKLYNVPVKSSDSNLHFPFFTWNPFSIGKCHPLSHDHLLNLWRQSFYYGIWYHIK